VLRAAARHALPIRWLPERVAEQNFNIGEPPTRASPWARVLLGHLAAFRQALAGQAALSPADVDEARFLQPLLSKLQPPAWSAWNCAVMRTHVSPAPLCPFWRALWRAEPSLCCDVCQLPSSAMQ
jgi:hypothetical protein